MVEGVRKMRILWKEMNQLGNVMEDEWCLRM